MPFQGIPVFALLFEGVFIGHLPVIRNPLSRRFSSGSGIPFLLRRLSLIFYFGVGQQSDVHPTKAVDYSVLEGLDCQK